MSAGNKQQGFECPKCKNNYSTAYSMYRHMRKVHNCDINRRVTLYCPIENCMSSYDRYNALDTHLTHHHMTAIRKETLEFSNLPELEAWIKQVSENSKTKYIKRSCNKSYRYYRCHRSGLPKTSTDKINTMKSSVKIGHHCPSRIIAKMTHGIVQVEFVPTHIGHECEIAKIPLSQKKRMHIACRLATTTNSVAASVAAVAVPPNGAQQQSSPEDQEHQQQVVQSQLNTAQHPHHNHDQHLQTQQQPQPPPPSQHGNGNNTINNTAPSLNVGTVNANSQATTSTIIQNDNSLMVTLAPMRATNVQQPDQQQIGHPMQQTHIMQTTQQLTQSQIPNNNVSLMTTISPNRQELASRFEQLMLSIRSDKHASIVKAQLEVCFALIRD